MMRLLIAICVLAAMFSTSNRTADVAKEQPGKPIVVEPVPVMELPRVGSYDGLKKIVKGMQVNGYGNGFMTMAMESVSVTKAKSSDAAAPAAAPTADNAASGSADYSATNVQVQGVDEADVVKTDGKYIYKVNDRRIVIVDAYPVGSMKVAGTIEFSDDRFYPMEMYVEDGLLVVIGQTYYDYNVVMPQTDPAGTNETSVKSKLSKKMIAPYPNPMMQMVQVKVYDIRNKAKAQLVRESEMEGHYVSSRKIGASLYLVTNKYLDVYTIMNELPVEGYAGTQADYAAPAFRDSALGEDVRKIAYEDIRYFPEPAAPNYLLVGGLNIDKPDEAMEVTAYLGSGQNIYASLENLYVAVTKFEAAPTQGTMERADVVSESSTEIYKFALAGGSVKYLGQGNVPGTILNQFSMDEHDGYFRIATTKGDMWRTDENTSKNNVYILDEELRMTGKIEDIAPGERIYSVRFMGDRGYMVTFKTVDPLFVIDLKNPSDPKILGALKIPGYSDYLHPYDENHIIGFGKDTVEMSWKDGAGNDLGAMAYHLGMKIALFDVSDVANPKEKFKVGIGDRGTYSELLHNHKALLFSNEKKLLAFPVTVMEVKNKAGNSNNEEILQYGEFTFQGAYVYSLDLERGFVLRGRISHLSENDLKKAGQSWYDSRYNVDRLLYIDNTLYTLSQSMIKAHDLTTLVEKGFVKLP